MYYFQYPIKPTVIVNQSTTNQSINQMEKSFPTGVPSSKQNNLLRMRAHIFTHLMEAAMQMDYQTESLMSVRTY